MQNNIEIIIENDDYDNNNASEIIEKDSPLESSTHKEPSIHKDISKITRNYNNTSQFLNKEIKFPANLTKDAKDDDKDILKRNTRMRNTDSDDNNESTDSLIKQILDFKDVLINERIENNSVDSDKFCNPFTIRVHLFNYNYNVYELN
ncbi:hypothetical protein C1646_752536 [Rhizophagus diaphanus]|nr:hypothetical protein C1646_752536 [Rhizophagus diaphanus] [Rhizophagus sp. MUCL 43196]